jgi:hypothetical protein
MQELLPYLVPAEHRAPDRAVLHALNQAGVQVMARPARTLLALAADLLWPRTTEPAARRDEVIGRLASIVPLLLSARRMLLLRWDAARNRYVLWLGDGARVLRETSAMLGPATVPLSALVQLQRGMVVDRPSKNSAVDRQLGHLLGPGSGVLLPISTHAATFGVLAFDLPAPPRPAGAQLALALAQQAATFVTRQE